MACLDDKLRRVENSDEGLAPLPQALRDRGPAVALAYTYLGDAVWEVYSRQHMILRKAAEHAKAGTKTVALRPMEATKRGWCSSVAMHGHLMRLVDGDVLSSEELAVLKWGRDFGHESRSGHKSEAHKEASALEALVAATSLPFSAVYPHRRAVAVAATAALDDPPRRVRRGAARCREVWLALDAKS